MRGVAEGSIPFRMIYKTLGPSSVLHSQLCLEEPLL